MPLREARTGGVVDDHEAGSPFAKSQVADVFFELLGPKASTYDSFPSGHNFPFLWAAFLSRGI
jgi:hypothetical protein